MSILDVSHLTKHYGPKDGGFTAVSDISFSLEEGEILGFLGPNGAGKTTTIQMLLGVLTATSGTISYFGLPLETNREQILEKVNFSSTYTNLPWGLSVYENLHYTSFLYQIENRKKRIDTIVEHFRLKNLLKLRTSELSAGQLTRMNIAKAFMNFPRVLLLDEPTASLDPEVALYVREFILSQRKNYKVSIIFTSHNMSEVEEVCDRILFLSGGKIIANDTPENLSKTIERCRVKLTLPHENFTEVIGYTKTEHMDMTTHGAHCEIELLEKQIPSLLSFIAKRDIYYSEISIEKPDLEDYFLKVASSHQFKEL